MFRSLSTSLLIGALTLAPAPVAAQCGGQGGLVLEVIAVGNTGTVPGAEVIIRVTGRPFELVCFACDTGSGATVIPGLGTLCLPVTSNFVEFAFFLPASGIAETRITLPTEASSTLTCCQAIGLDFGAPNNVAFSNLFCFAVEPPCTSGGFAEVGYITKFTGVTSFPVQVSSGVVGSSGGGGSPVTSVTYDPVSPPTFPVNDNAAVFIENIARIGDDLYVTTLVRGAAPLVHQSHPGRLPNNLAVTVTVGAASNAYNPLHVSCSQPLAVGMVFGPLTITTAKTYH